MHHGVTLIELLLVISLLALLAAGTTPFLSRYYLAAQTGIVADQVVSTLRKAQANAMDEVQGAVWGACVSGSSIRLYSGSCGSPTYSEDYAIPTSVGVSGFTNTTFTLRGEPSAALAITVATAVKNESISLSAAGGLGVN